MEEDGFLEVLVSAYGIDYWTLCNSRVHGPFIAELINRVDMRLAGAISEHRFRDGDPTRWVTVYSAIIYTSDIILRVWPHYGEIALELFSCKSFVPATVSKCVEEFYHTKDIEMHSIRRATRSPRIDKLERAPAVALQQ